ncbi:hypothetical protein ACIPRI_23880 [Variovorax sp. LARHSF232]
MMLGAGLLSNLPPGLRQELVGCYQKIVQNYVEGRWEPAELNGGKLCEIVYSVLDGALSGSFPAKASKPSRMLDACKALENKPADSNRVGDRSLRVLLPRLLPFLYEIRNNRGVGHVGGDVDPNHEDAEAVLAMSTWIMAELVRVFHGMSLADAQVAVDAMVQRKHPLVWQTEGTKRVLNPKMKKSDQALVLLYSEPGWVELKRLSEWVEYSSNAMFRSRVLAPLHKLRLVELDTAAGRTKLTPLGARRVEVELLPSI